MALDGAMGVGSGTVITTTSNVTFKLDSNAPFCDASTKLAATFSKSSNDNFPENRWKMQGLVNT